METKYRVKSIMTVNSWILLIGFLAAATITQSASAVNRTFSIDPYGVLLADGATSSAGSFGSGGIKLPNSGTPDISFGFVIPNDYLPNSPIRIILSWHAPETGCDFALLPNFVDRTRPNHLPSTGSASGGLDPANGSNILTAPATSNLGNKKVYFLTPNQGFVDQQPGDAILLGFFRNAANVNDNCTGNLIIPGIAIKYQTL
ncbi:MAG: hypothetical protein PHF31_04610 [Methylobacter sp.]|nr:hypothetical protein [Methylobacter sp.]